MAGLEDSLSEDDFTLGQTLSQNAGDQNTRSPLFNFQVLTEASNQEPSDLSSKSMDCLSDSLDDDKFSKLAQLQSPSFLQEKVTKECLKKIKSNSSKSSTEDKKPDCDDVAKCLFESPPFKNKHEDTVSPASIANGTTSSSSSPKQNMISSLQNITVSTSTKVPAGILLKEAPKVKPSFGKKRVKKQPTSTDQGDISKPIDAPVNGPEAKKSKSKKIPKSEVVSREGDGQKQLKEKKTKKKMTKQSDTGSECKVSKKAKIHLVKNEKKKEPSGPLKGKAPPSTINEGFLTSTSQSSTSEIVSEKKIINKIKSEGKVVAEIQSEGNMVAEIKSEEIMITEIKLEDKTPIKSEENIASEETKTEGIILKKPFFSKKNCTLPLKKICTKESCFEKEIEEVEKISQDLKPIKDEMPSCSSAKSIAMETEVSGSNKQNIQKTGKKKVYSKEEIQDTLQKKKESKQERDKERELKKIEKEWKRREKERIKKEKQDELKAKREARKIEIEEKKKTKELKKVKKFARSLNSSSLTSSEHTVGGTTSLKENSSCELRKDLRSDILADVSTVDSPATESTGSIDQNVNKNSSNYNQAKNSAAKIAMKPKKTTRKRASKRSTYEDTSSDEPDTKKPKSSVESSMESELALCSGTSSEIESGIVMLDSPSSFSTDSFTPCHSNATDKRNPRVKTLTKANVAGPVWVQCCNMWCRKWRQLKDQFDPLSVPSHWICSDNTDTDHNDCSLPSEKWSDYESENFHFVESTFGPGSVVWAKLSTYPW